MIFHPGLLKMQLDKKLQMRKLGLFLVTLWLMGMGCKENEGPVNPPAFVAELSATPLQLEFGNDGGENPVAISSNTTWQVVSDAAWCRSNIQTSRNDATIRIIADANDVESMRTAIVTISAEEVEDVTIAVSQEAKEPDPIEPEIPDSIAPDATGMESNATQLVAKMKVGWNIGNSLEVPGSETAWGNPVVSKTLIDGVKNAGFNAIRIPCAWDSHLESQETYKIQDAWLARVKEVVDYCVDNEMYAMLNIHWDGGWLEEHPMYEFQEEVNKKQYAIWKQIAKYFRDYNEYLMFAGTNEVRENYGNPSAENIIVQESYVQTFVDAVRSTGGKNAYRNLVVQTYNTNVDHGINHHTMPADRVDNRLIVEVHYYDPWEFTIKTDGGYNTQWGEGYTDVTGWGQEDFMEAQFNKLKNKYIDNGIPLVIGEYSAMLRGDMPDDLQAKHEESRNYYHKTLNEEAKKIGIVTFYWDNGYTTPNASGLFNRKTGVPVHVQAIEAIVNVY